MLKVKDIFTAVTIILGFLVLVFASQGEFLLASLMILLGAISDSLDGLYARLTKTGNKFGAEFDTIADLVIFSMAPAILLFFVYKDYNIILATVIGILPLLFGCIRLARFNVKHIEYPGYWMGLARPASAIGIVSFVNSKLFQSYDLMIFGAIFVIFLSIMNITMIPYFGHHKRKFNKFQKLLIIITILLISASIPFGFFWDILLIFTLLYILSPFTISKKERVKLREFIRNWKNEKKEV